MSDQSEFEKWIINILETEPWGGDSVGQAYAEGARAARHWIINEAHRLAYTDGYLRPSELEEACK